MVEAAQLPSSYDAIPERPCSSMCRFAFDYLYNLVVILILAAIISGIIIDTFANMRADLSEKNDDQENNCFICGINRSQMERQMVKFEHHVFQAAPLCSFSFVCSIQYSYPEPCQEHYMWSYARFLMQLGSGSSCWTQFPKWHDAILSHPRRGWSHSSRFLFQFCKVSQAGEGFRPERSRVLRQGQGDETGSRQSQQ